MLRREPANTSRTHARTRKMLDAQSALSPRLAEVEDVVDPILFLLSNRSAMINGAMLPIEGGFLCG